VQGRLVQQSALDESAVQLLDRIKEERSRMGRPGMIKPQAEMPVRADEIPFAVPPGWSTTRLGTVAVCLDHLREPVNATDRARRNLGKQGSDLFPYYGATQQQGWIDDYLFDEVLVLLGEDGVPFFDELRPKAYLIAGKAWVNNHAHVFRGVHVSGQYLVHYLNTFDYSGRVAGATRPKLNQSRALDIPIALPPLAEQLRIVAKVEELMAFCDALEECLRRRDDNSRALLMSILDAALRPTLSQSQKAVEVALRT
jgi:type I restriction enzyme S subunit